LMTLNSQASKQIILWGQRLIKQLGHVFDALTMLTRVRLDRLRSQVIVSDVDRRHDSDAFQSDDFAAVANLAHFAVEISNRLQQTFAFFFRTSNPELPAHDGDIKAYVIGHAFNLGDKESSGEFEKLRENREDSIWNLV
jgi:hypothetical protein